MRYELTILFYTSEMERIEFKKVLPNMPNNLDEIANRVKERLFKENSNVSLVKATCQVNYD